MSDNDNAAGNETIAAGGEGGATAAAAMRKDDQADASGEVRQAPYGHVGQAFTAWFNDKLRQLPNAQIRLGTKTAQAVRLLPDGRLECSLASGTGEDEQTFVAFEGQYLDQLVRKIGALGL